MASADVMVLRALRGAPLSVVVALCMISPASAGEVRLAALTGYDRVTVRYALGSLAELGFVQRQGRYDAWRSTAQVVQLGLAYREGEILTIAGGSGGSETQLGISEDSTTTTTGREGEILTIELRDAAGELAREYGLSMGKALQVVESSVRGGWDAGTLVAALVTWGAYVRSDRSRGIRNPGAFVASRLASCTPAPRGAESLLSGDERRRLGLSCLPAGWEDIIER